MRTSPSLRLVLTDGEGLVGGIKSLASPVKAGSHFAFRTSEEKDSGIVRHGQQDCQT